MRNICQLVLLVKDTGTVSVDTFSPEAPPGPTIIFVTSNEEYIRPIYNKSEFQLTEQNIKPGDANGDNKVNLADIIYFVNYLYKNGPEPISRQLSDVNVDCKLDLGDLIYIINYIFKGGSKPLPGCFV